MGGIGGSSGRSRWAVAHAGGQPSPGCWDVARQGRGPGRGPALRAAQPRAPVCALCPLLGRETEASSSCSHRPAHLHAPPCRRGRGCPRLHRLCLLLGLPAPPAICLMSGDLCCRAGPASFSLCRPPAKSAQLAGFPWQPGALTQGPGGWSWWARPGGDSWLLGLTGVCSTLEPAPPPSAAPRRIHLQEGGPQHPDTRLPRVGTLTRARARGTRLGHTGSWSPRWPPGCSALSASAHAPPRASWLSREPWPRCREGTVGVLSHGTQIHSFRGKEHLLSHGGGAHSPAPSPASQAPSPAVPEGWWKDAALTAHLAVKASESRVSTWPAWGGAGHTVSH